VSEVVFTESDHSYRVGGARYPSVTQVIADMGLYGNAADYFTEWSRERGSFVHRIIQWHLSGELDEATIDPALRPYFAAWRRFEREAGYVSDACEKVMASDFYKFAGTVDHIGHLNGYYCIIDVKTGALTPATAIQMGGYEVLMKSPGIRRFGLRLMDTGKYSLKEYKDRQDSKIFLAALSVYYWKQDNRLSA
jgi:hypothetical protein